MGGGQKFRQLVGGMSIIERVRMRIAPQVGELIVSGRGAGLEDLGLPVVLDARPDDGPIAGVEAALGWAAAAHGADCLVLTVAADTPFLPRDLAARLLRARQDADAEMATAASVSGTHPIVSLWPVRLGPGLSSWLATQADRSIQGFIRTRRGVGVSYDDPVDPFFNVNLPADLVAAQDLLRTHPELSA